MCKINLCMKCDLEHNPSLKIIKYKGSLPNIDDINYKMNKLKNTFNKFKNNFDK